MPCPGIGRAHPFAADAEACNGGLQCGAGRQWCYLPPPREQSQQAPLHKPPLAAWVPAAGCYDLINVQHFPHRREPALTSVLTALQGHRLAP